MQLVALARAAQLVGAWSHHRKVMGLIPDQSTYLGCGFNPLGMGVYDPPG